MSKINTIKGFADLYAPESTLHAFMEDAARRVFGAYGYGELRIPIMEYTELFRRSIGAETDVVQKEMYTFPDRKGRSLTLRPEATAGIVRSYIEHSCHAREEVSKLFSFGPMFRYERPQKGRMRQFHQIDCECLGAHEPQADAEVLLMLMHFLREIGLSGLRPEINTLGCAGCRPGFRKILAEYLRGLAPESLCENCRRRMETNPMRVLDCKTPTCREHTAAAPRIPDHVCGECDEHFKVVLAILEQCSVPYTLNPRLVRGLDYYTRTTFEVVSDSIGAQGSVAGGGRYDGLVSHLGGPEVPAIGFACGMERLALMLADKAPASGNRLDFYVAVLDPAAANVALTAAQAMREAGLSGEISFAAKSLKSQLRQASRLNADHCLILGPDELAARNIIVKRMDNGEQVSIPLVSLGDWAEIRYNDKSRQQRKDACRQPHP